MTASVSNQLDPPILGTDGNDVIRVDTSVTFVWVPDPGNAYSQNDDVFYVDDQGTEWQTTSYTGPSHASGTVTFDGVSSSEAFQASPTSLSFQFSNGWEGSGEDLYPGTQWSWNPATGTLDPNYASGSWDDWIGESFDQTSATIATAHWSGDTNDTELGHWALAPDPHNVDVFGGGGDDTIYGGQGQELLSGDDGNDAIHAGQGDQTALGGDGSDAIWGGVGTQILDGGDGNDVIRGGTGAQFLLGDAGDDVLWGGTGPQFLLGGDGNDVLHAGNGNETLSGGSGRDTFVFANGVSGTDVIDDFRRGQDLIEVARNINGMAIGSTQALTAHISAGPGGDAVLDLGGGASVTLRHVSAQQAIAHAQDDFRIV